MQQANLTSLEHLSLLHEALAAYRGKMSKELESLRVELRRLANWISVEARQYWSTELTKATRYMVECQDALTRCQSYVRESERRPCTEEKKRLAKAKARRQLCEQMVRMAAAASTAWEREQTKNHAKVQRLADLLESDLNVASGHLMDQINTIEKYTGITRSSVAGLPSTQGVATDSAATTDGKVGS